MRETDVLKFQPQGGPRSYWLHGTKVDLKRGDLVLPRRDHGGKPTIAPTTIEGARHPDADNCVHLTTHHKLAWAYAHASGGDGPPIVLFVEPLGAVAHDDEHSEGMPTYVCASARVLLVDYAPAISSEEAAARWILPDDGQAVIPPPED